MVVCSCWGGDNWLLRPWFSDEWVHVTEMVQNSDQVTHGTCTLLEGLSQVLSRPAAGLPPLREPPQQLVGGQAATVLCMRLGAVTPLDRPHLP
jgi:hypothetical protein